MSNSIGLFGEIPGRHRRKQTRWWTCDGPTCSGAVPENAGLAGQRRRAAVAMRAPTTGTCASRSEWQNLGKAWLSLSPSCGEKGRRSQAELSCGWRVRSSATRRHGRHTRASCRAPMRSTAAWHSTAYPLAQTRSTSQGRGGGGWVGMDLLGVLLYTLPSRHVFTALEGSGRPQVLTAPLVLLRPSLSGRSARLRMQDLLCLLEAIHL